MMPVCELMLLAYLHACHQCLMSVIRVGSKVRKLHSICLRSMCDCESAGVGLVCCGHPVDEHDIVSNIAPQLRSDPAVLEQLCMALCT